MLCPDDSSVFLPSSGSAWPEDNLQHQRVWGAASTSCRSLPSTSATTKVFGKYLQPLERTDIILTAIEAMTDASISDKEGASSMLDEAMKDPNSWLTDVPKIMSGIHGNLEHICVAPARHSVDSLLLLLTNRCPREVVKSLLKCSPPVDSAALAMWEVMFSRLQPLEKVLRELRIELRNQRMRRLFSTVLEDTCILQLTLLAASDVRAKEFAATYNLWRSLRHQSLEMLSLVLQGLVTLSQRPETARKMRVLLEDIVETLESGNEDIQMKALLVFRNMLGHMRRQEASPIALQLAEKLLPLFNHESSQLREFSLRLFREVMQKVAWRHKRQMRKNVRQGLLPLFFHLSDQSQSVAKAESRNMCHLRVPPLESLRTGQSSPPALHRSHHRPPASRRASCCRAILWAGSRQNQREQGQRSWHGHFPGLPYLVQQGSAAARGHRTRESLQASQLSPQVWEARALSLNPCPPGLCPREPQMSGPGHVPAS
ncbi:uncharacterized protein WM294_017120 [Sarcoramphus papa]